MLGGKVELLRLLPGHLVYPARAVRGPLHRVVVQDDGHAVGGEREVELDALGPASSACAHRRERVLRGVGSRGAVCDGTEVGVRLAPRGRTVQVERVDTEKGVARLGVGRG